MKNKKDAYLGVRISADLKSEVTKKANELGITDSELVVKCIQESLAAVALGETRLKDVLSDPGKLASFVAAIEKHSKTISK